MPSAAAEWEKPQRHDHRNALECGWQETLAKDFLYAGYIYLAAIVVL
jgi:hypothetical protein